MDFSDSSSSYDSSDEFDSDTPEFSDPKQKRCEDCGLYIDRAALECPHCSELSQRQLSILKYKLRVNKRKQSKLGKISFIIAIVILILLTTL